jgi:TPR repeat protein
MDLYREVAAADPNFRNGVAQFRLCQMYGTGKGVNQDFIEARSWCRRSAKQGNGSAYLVLGRMAEQGLGGAKDLKEAADWYQDAAIANLRDGFMFSGEVKLKSGSHEDQRTAYYWFFMAQTLKIPGADAKLQEASTGLTDKEIAEQQKKANKWLHAPGNERMKNLKVH